MDEIFQYLEHADKRCIVAIDEFQQIAKYPEKNIEALLRTHIQKQMNTNFIFAGSERHMMQEMFSSATRPFCNSADMMELKAIVPEIYVPFIVGLFEKCKRRIGPADVEKVYNLFKGHTYFREILSNIPEKQKALLYAIAGEGEAERITSSDFIKRHGLTSASSVQSAAKKLLEKDIITETNKVFSVTDKLFSMWIARIYGGFPII